MNIEHRKGSLISCSRLVYSKLSDEYNYEKVMSDYHSMIPLVRGWGNGRHSSEIMGGSARYDELVKEFEHKLNRKLTNKELEFILWLVEQ
ncbi:hypothetical protein GCM10009001_35900 [Virgibacillus siamensis]|uniref:Uncharacterized protein n=1 Tax=Virgibacillus siamensis TaxID=480071 RepID=A0ABN1GNX3_9BACI